MTYKAITGWEKLKQDPLKTAQLVLFPLAALSFKLSIVVGVVTASIWALSFVTLVARKPRPSGPDHDERWLTLVRDSMAVAFSMVWAASLVYFLVSVSGETFELTATIVSGTLLAAQVIGGAVIWIRER